MAIQASGAISLANVQTEFGGANPISLSEYYRNGAYVTPNNTSVPTSGTIALSSFYNAVKQFEYTISSSIQQHTINSTWLTGVGWDGTAPVIINIGSGVYVWSDSVSIGGLTIATPLTLNNYGYIIGRGGNGANGGGNYGQAGGPALVSSTSGITINNMSGAFIAGGGGGGGANSGNGAGGAGGGAGGGVGGTSQRYNPGGAGGAIGAAGANASPSYGWTTGQADNLAGYGGGSGGGGSSSADFNSGHDAGGGGGGRILPGVGGAYGGWGGAGGSAGNAGTSNYSTDSNPDKRGGGGGGGWGASGGAGNTAGQNYTGGAGGAAISGTATTRTNNGTIYGSVV
jgi:hypothetical protein